MTGFILIVLFSLISCSNGKDIFSDFPQIPFPDLKDLEVFPSDNKEFQVNCEQIPAPNVLEEYSIYPQIPGPDIETPKKINLRSHRYRHYKIPLQIPRPNGQIPV